MKTLRICFLYAILLNSSMIYSQNYDFKNYINSFKKSDSNKIYKTGELINIYNQMTREEALLFVYSGDTSKLYCHYKIFSMETEKIKGNQKELMLPNKCILLNMKDYYLIGFSSNECQDPEKLPLVLLTLNIVDNNYKIRDSLIVYKGNEYEPSISSLINSNNAKIFLIGDIQNIGYKQVYLYKINDKTLKFEKIKEENNIDESFDNLMNIIELLKWEDFFMN